MYDSFGYMYNSLELCTANLDLVMTDLDDSSFDLLFDSTSAPKNIYAKKQQNCTRMIRFLSKHYYWQGLRKDFDTLTAYLLSRFLAWGLAGAALAAEEPFSAGLDTIQTR
jgi:hypothetical protein